MIMSIFNLGVMDIKNMRLGLIRSIHNNTHLNININEIYFMDMISHYLNII